MNNTIVILIIILCTLFLIYLYTNKFNRNNNVESFSNTNTNTKKNKETFQLDIDNIDINNLNENNIEKDKNNLIINGSFNNGKNSANFINQNGYNKIIAMKNPTTSSYVLEQRKSENTFYELSLESQINSAYLLYFWIKLDNNTDIQLFNMEKYLNIRIPGKDFQNYLPRKIYTIIKNVNFNENEKWYLFKVQFNTNNNILDKIYITFSLNNNNSICYLTGISLYRVLNDAKNFILNDKLICYTDAVTYESNNNIFRDLSGQGNDLTFSNIPTSNMSSGYIDLENTKITGFPSNIINNDEFTIFLIINKQDELPIINSLIEKSITIKDINKDTPKENPDNIYEKILFSFPGNNKYSFEIGIYKDYLYLFNDKIKVKSSEKLNYFNKASLSIIYKDNSINIFMDGMNILSTKIDKIYFNKNNFIINKNKNIELFLYSFLVYNKVLSSKELRDIREYFITNQNKDYNRLPNILEHSFENVFHQTNNPNPLIKPFEDLNMNGMIDNDTFQNKYDNQSNALKNICMNNCNNLCKQYLYGDSPDLEKYRKCAENCKYVLSECNNFCSDESNKDTLYCKTTNNDDSDINCPKVYKKNGKYHVYVLPNSYYSNVFSGEKSFGTNIDKARHMYSINFPKCIIPDELYKGGNNKNKNNNCPYVINDLNPCNTGNCVDVNWNVKDYNKLKLNDKCKKAVSNYCHINYDYDENCICWDPAYKDNAECIKVRKFFENPKDYCLPGSFNIEDHPDFNKYIKKDNIPCWGCDLKS